MKSQHGQMAFDRADRYVEDGKMKCLKGKECNGRCIPKHNQCGSNREVALKGVAAVAGGGAALAGLLGGAQAISNHNMRKSASKHNTGANPAPTAAPENGRQVALPAAPNRPMLSNKSTAAGGGAIAPTKPASVAVRVKPSQKLSTQMIETGKATAAAVKQGYQEGPGNPEAFKKAGKAAGRAVGKVVIKARKKINEITGK